MRPETIRNVAIIVGIAIVVTLLGSTGSATISYLVWAMNILILAAILYFGYTLWRSNRHRIAWLPQRQKTGLYLAAGGLVLLVVSSTFWVDSMVTTILFFALAGACGYAIYRIWQDAQRYY